MKPPASFALATRVMLAIVVGCSAALAAPAPTPVPVRQPKYPLKAARTLHDNSDIARARENVKRYAAARKIADRVIALADRWVEWKDEDLRFLLTSPDVPRAFAVSAAGCPKCGPKIIEKGRGDYGWVIDPRRPFKVQCPVDGSVYPTNDYERYYRSGFAEKAGWDSAYVDDGGGAPAGEGRSAEERYWFVAYYNHWMWYGHLVPAVEALANAYTLTGDRRYAHKAAVMLHRVAEVYPGMDHARQSRYGTLLAARGGTYPGKVVNLIWETGLAESLAKAYDGVWETIDADAELQRQTGKSGEQIRAFIEANFLEDAIDAYFERKIRGNFGMHQSALVHLARVRQHGPTERWFDGLMNENADGYQRLGLNYALYNLISRDGVPMEVAPGYNEIWVREITQLGDLLQPQRQQGGGGREAVGGAGAGGGHDVFAIPRVRRMYDAVIDQMHLGGKFTASLGDSGSVYGALVGADPRTFQTAHRRFPGDARYAALLARLGATGEKSFRTVESLFREPVDVPAGAMMPPAKPRLLDGYGLAVLNNAADTVSLALTYGPFAGHGHYDRLGIEIFAHGRPVLPDLGYPDAMNDFVPGIYTWSKNTVSHNTVVVDAGRQSRAGRGEAKIFAAGKFARVVDVEAKDVYPQCASYRRATIMVDVDDENSYFVDVFTVAGGRQHDYSLHGPPGDFSMNGGAWSEPAKGTLAGEDVAIGAIYDDEKLAKARGGFTAYAGSGFQHLFNVRALKPGGERDWVAEFAHERDKATKVRLRILDQPGQQLFLCDARVSPVKNPTVLKYFIARRTAAAAAAGDAATRPATGGGAGGGGLTSRFVSVIEPFRDQPLIRRVTPLLISPGGEGVALAVERADGKTDVVVYDPAGTRKKIRSHGIDTPAEVAVTTFTGGAVHREPLRSFRAFAAVAPNRGFAGKVVGVLPLRSAVFVAADPERPFDPADLPGRVVHFVNDRRRTAHTVKSVERDRETGHSLLTLGDDLLIGMAKVDAVEPQHIRTSTALPFAPSYAGATLADDLFRLQHPVKQVGDGKIVLSAPLPTGHPIQPGDDVWLLDAGVGDSVEIPLIRSIEHE